METVRLRHFKTVVEAGGLMKASELLGITGGGLSKSIKALEDELGLKLFQQRGRGLELTEIGEEFYNRLPIALKALEDLIDLKDITAHQEQAVRFASFEVFSTYFLSEFVSDQLANNHVEIREAIPGGMEQLISEGSSDIGITYEPIPTKGVEFLKVSKIRMAVYANPKSKFHEKDLNEIPFVVPTAPLQGTPSGVRGLDGWPEHLFERNVLFKVEMLETALQLTHRGVAASFLPVFVAEAFNAQGILSSGKIIEVKLSSNIKKVHRDVFIIQRKGADESKLIKKLARYLRKIPS